MPHPLKRFAPLLAGLLLLWGAAYCQRGRVLLTETDLIETDRLVEQLKDEQHPVSAFLQTKLSAALRARLAESRSDVAPNAALRAQLVAELNRVIQGEALYQPTRFANLNLSDDTLRFTGLKPTGKRLWRLNRRLLAESYLHGITPTGGLNGLREKHELVQATVLKNAPPELAFTTVALGAFNGLIADFLWMRALRLQEQAKYFEAVQLADWITKLQPRFSQVWLFQSWNMAWNISVEFPHDPMRGWQDRWLWIQRGAELLREQGMLYNPNDPELYRELAWIFFDKMGTTKDDANLYYKQQWAGLMTTLFDGAEPDYESLINAPRTIEQLRQNAAVARLLDLCAEKDVDLAEHFLLIQAEQLDVPESIKALLNDPANQPAVDTLSLYARARTLREKYKLDPTLMQRLDEEYGKLEWRLPEAHGVYWTVRGLELDPEGKDIHYLNNDRVLLHALESNFERGRIVMMAQNGVPLTEYNPNVIDKLHQYWNTLEERYPDDRNSLATGHNAFIRAAARILYLYNRPTDAMKYFRLIQRRVKEFQEVASIDEFVLQEFKDVVEQTGGQLDTYNFVRGMIERSIFYLATGDEDQAAGSEGIARFVYDKYVAEWKKEGRAIPPWDEIKRDVIRAFLANDQIEDVFRERIRGLLGGAPGGAGAADAGDEA